MNQVPRLDLEKLPGYRWLPNGQSSLSGDMLQLFRDISLPWDRWQRQFGAVEHECPTFIAAQSLGKMKYFSSFPQHVTFAVNLDWDDSNLKAFCQSKTVDADGCVQMAATAAVKNALTPAPCYHLYPQFAGRTLDKPVFLRTRNAVFRREVEYQPLVRQWNFHAEEIVCLGSLEEVRSFLASMAANWDDFFSFLGIPTAWKQAVDPFFNPGQNPGALLQKLDPVKKELTLDGKLALGSANFHRNFFCDVFGIRREGKTAFSGCVGWGMERLLYAVVSRFGYDKKNWPDLRKRYGQ